MSKSRLEKFLYALYSLDSSDLPTPLSRIEELYNCWVTGEEAPTFEPLSRVEKYLMAILGGYDVVLLPNPLSRAEVLLYKLATGDDSLEDFDIFLSEHEYLLAEIIRNGGVGGNIDIEYVLYSLSEEHNTLYNTAEKPVKSAILKGQTKIIDELGNECQSINSPKAIIGAWINTSTGEEVSSTTSFRTTFLKCPKITFVIKGNNKYRRIIYYDKNKSYISGFYKGIGDNTNIIITSSDIPTNAVYMRISASIHEGDVSYTPDVNLFIEDENGNNLYITHLESVKMPVLTTIGKNLFDGKILNNNDVNGNTGQETGFGSRTIPVNFIKVTPNTTYTFTRPVANGNVGIRYYSITQSFISSDSFTGYNGEFNVTFTTPENCYFIKFIDEANTLVSAYQIEKGAIATTYEPYKTNILTVNEEVELRGVGHVYDELNLETGELTERIGEIVLDGSENWRNATTTGAVRFSINLENSTTDNKRSPIISDYFPYVSSGHIYPGAFVYGDMLYVYLEETTTLEEFITWLGINKPSVQYQLATESIKTVDLSVVDQDGNNTKLSTFDDITHVTLSSEGLIPEAELEVATKNEEVLNTMSLKMDDISKTQNDLQETLDTQSENVDATMIATTEIYEGLL